MKQIVRAFLLLLIGGLVNGATVQNILQNPDFSSGMAHWELTGTNGKATPGKDCLVLDIQKSSNSGSFKLSQPLENMKVGQIYYFYFTVLCEKPQTRPVVVSYRMRRKAKNLGFIKWVPLKQGLQRLCLEIVPGENSSDLNDPPVISFYLGELDGRVVLSDLQLVDLGTVMAEPPPFSETWTVFGLVDPSVQVVDSIPAALPGIREKMVKPFRIKVPPVREDKNINLRLEVGVSRKKFKDPAMLYNEFNASADGLLPVGFGADWYMELHLNGQLVYSTMENGNGKNPVSAKDHLVFLPVKKGKNLLAVKVLAGSQGWRLCWGGVEPPPAPEVFTAKEGFFPIALDRLAVKKDTALDLSGIIDAPAGKYGRAVLSPAGRVVFEKNPQPQRFFGFSSHADESVWKTSSDKEFDRLVVEYARAIRAQGYNLFRMHGFDSWIMAYSKEDKKPLPRYLDRWDRMVYEMKRQGIYLQLNLFAFWLYASEKDWFPVAEKRMANKVLFLVGEPALRARFAEMAGKVMNHVNPYTGLAWKDDPVFIAMEYYNELGLGVEYAGRMKFSYPDDYKFFMDKWRGFLQKKYANLPKEKCPHSEAVMTNPRLPVAHDRSQLRVDYDEFWYENMKETYRFCDQVMKDNGYKGLTTQCPMPALRCTAAFWESIQIPDAHGYHCHPYNGEQPGSKVVQVSSIEEGASLFNQSFGRRIYGRPFFFNEHNYVFRNPYQYEKPVALDAYAAFQDWDARAIHAGAVALKNDRRADSFHAANNPVLRAGEFLASLFFLRRDVAPAKHKVAVALNKDYVFSIGNSANALSPALSPLALLTNVASLFTDLPRYRNVPELQKPDMTLVPGNGAEIEWHGWFAAAKKSAVKDSSLGTAVKRLRSHGILSGKNKTDLSKKIYQSETGELTLFAKEKKVTVITPKSEAVALIAGKQARLDVLDIRKNSVNTLIGLASVDNKSLKASNRMVLVLSTRIANTNMQHDPSGELLRVIGTLPILYQCGQYNVRIARKEKMRCYALSLTGERKEEIPLISSADGCILSLDVAKLKQGPTPFFELVTEESGKLGGLTDRSEYRKR